MISRIAEPGERGGRVFVVDEKLAKSEVGRDEVVSGTEGREMDRGI